MPRYIDADAFVQAEIERCGSQPVVGTCTMDNEYLSIRIAAAPTISPDEVRGVGKWIDKPYFTECSVCHAEFDSEVTRSEIYGWPWVYCPKCGARLEVTDDA